MVSGLFEAFACKVATESKSVAEASVELSQFDESLASITLTSDLAARLSTSARPPEWTTMSSVAVASPFELTLFVRDRPDGTLGATLQYARDLYEPETERAGEADLIIAKHRNGPTGSFNVAWMSRYAKFASLSHPNVPGQPQAFSPGVGSESTGWVRASANGETFDGSIVFRMPSYIVDVKVGGMPNLDAAKRALVNAGKALAKP
jgi:hypothetical protein